MRAGLAILLSLLLPGPWNDFRTPIVEVRGDRLTVDEVIARAARIEEEALRCEIPRRFTSHLRLVAVYGDTAAPGRRREVIDEISRVEEGPGPRTVRSVLLWKRVETWRGDSLIEADSEEAARRRDSARIEEIRRIPLALRHGLFRYRILGRLRLSDQGLIHVSYRPRSGFAPLPEGEAWLSARDAVVLWQTGSLKRNVPLPFLVRSIDHFTLRRSRYGPIWLEDDMRMLVSLRRSFGGPDRLEIRIRLSDISVGGKEVAAHRAATGAVTESLARSDRAGADELLCRPLRFDSLRVTHYGDSILCEMAASPIASCRWRPTLRYGHAERLFTGVGVKLKGSSRGLPSLDLEGGYSTALRRMTGSSRLEIDAVTPWGWPAGGWAMVADEVHFLDPASPVIDLLGALVVGADRREGFLRRGGETGIWVGPARGLRVSMTARIVRDRAITSRSIWSLFGARSKGEPPVAFDPCRTWLLGLGLAMRGAWLPPWLELEGEGQTGRTTPVGGRSAETTLLRSGFTARPAFPGGERLSLRGEIRLGDADLPLQDGICLGGGSTLRGYGRGTLAGRSGYHVGGECFLNRDIVGWLPWVPDGGLGFEAFLGWDHGRILSHRRLPPGSDRGALVSVGVGFAATTGIRGPSRILVGLYRGLGKGDGDWRLRVEMEREERETGKDR